MRNKSLGKFCCFCCSTNVEKVYFVGWNISLSLIILDAKPSVSFILNQMNSSTMPLPRNQPSPLPFECLHQTSFFFMKRSKVIKNRNV